MMAKERPEALASKIQELEKRLTDAIAQGGSLNPLVDLLDSARDAADVSKVIFALYRVFVLTMDSGKLAPVGGAAGEAGKQVRSWLWERLNQFSDFLASLLKDEEKSLRGSALRIMFSLQKRCSSLFTTPSHPAFHISQFRKIVSALMLCPPSKRGRARKRDAYGGCVESDVRDLFVDSWLNVYDDVRWFFLRESASILEASEGDDTPANLLSFLERLSKFPADASGLQSWWIKELGIRPQADKTSSSDFDPDHNNSNDDDDWRKYFDEDKQESQPQSSSSSARPSKLSTNESLHSIASHKAVFTRAWLTLLQKFPVHDRALCLRVLNALHLDVVPNLTRPMLVMDWVGTCVDQGGSVGVLALSTLFTLMTGFNLDYPSFYARLYASLDRNVLHLKYRARFFRILELSLKSTHLPATLVASFIKRLSRLSLSASPAAIVMIIPFTYNMLKRHPALMCMIHCDETAVESQEDKFLADELNPNLTDAMRSSLWELVSHKRHYHSAVSTLAHILEEAFTKAEYQMEDFLDHTYSTMIDAAIARPRWKESAMAIDSGAKLFPTGSGDEGSSNDNDVMNLWRFDV